MQMITDEKVLPTRLLPATSRLRRVLADSAAFICVYLGSFVIPILLVSCGVPSSANIQLRKQNDQLQSKIEEQDRRHEADQATIAGLKRGATTAPTLSEPRLSAMFTTHGLKFGRLTAAGDDGVKVYVVPTDDDGQPIKAAGTFDVEAFDLSSTGETRLGRWGFDQDQSRQNWYGSAMLYTYVLKCPWQSRPAGGSVTIRLTFTDGLTGRVFTQQRELPIAKSSPKT